MATSYSDQVSGVGSSPTPVDNITEAGETVGLKAPCRVATTSNISLSGLQTIDGVTLVADDRVLVKDQTDESLNGIYIAASGAWSRAVDFDSNRDITRGTRVNVTDGTTYEGAEFRVSSDNPVEVGTDDIVFERTGNGDVVGPASATDGGFAKYDGTTGKLLKSSAAVIAMADGGFGRAFVDPNADRIPFWDDSAGQFDWLQLGTALAIVGNVLSNTRAVSLAMQVFTASGTYTPTPGMTQCVVLSTGAGGGGGGADSDGSSHAGAGGGGAGGTCIELFSAATIGASQTVTIGAAGSAGSTAGGNGGAGGNTTFGALHTANGGSGGVGTGNATSTNVLCDGGAGGTPSGGLLDIPGGAGFASGTLRDDGNSLFQANGGNGGPSLWGGGGKGGLVTSASTTQAGSAGAAWGSGGGGGANRDVAAGIAGGAGKAGVCVVLELVAA